MEIRLATNLDLPDLVRLNEQIQFQHAKYRPDVFKQPADPKNVSQHFEKLMNSGSNSVIVAINDDLVVAYLWYEIRRIEADTFEHKRHVFYIHEILVDQAARRQGAASALVKCVEMVAEVKKCKQISLDTWNLNRDAQLFFEQIGYAVSQLIYSKNLD